MKDRHEIERKATKMEYHPEVDSDAEQQRTMTELAWPKEEDLADITNRKSRVYDHIPGRPLQDTSTRALGAKITYNLDDLTYLSGENLQGYIVLTTLHCWGHRAGHEQCCPPSDPVLDARREARREDERAPEPVWPALASVFKHTTDGAAARAEYFEAA